MMTKKEHPTQIEILEFICGEKKELELHLTGCNLCQSRMENLIQEQKKFNLSHDPDTEIERIKEKQNFFNFISVIFSQKLVPALSAVAVIIAIIVAYPILKQEDNKIPAIRTKGALSVSLFIKREENLLEYTDNFKFKKGDKLRFQLTSPIDGFVSMLYENKTIIENSLIEKGKKVLIGGEFEITSYGEDKLYFIIAENKLDVKNIKLSDIKENKDLLIQEVTIKTEEEK